VTAQLAASQEWLSSMSDSEKYLLILKEFLANWSGRFANEMHA
jgi:hypothetical protein